VKIRFRNDSPHYAELAGNPEKASEWYKDDAETLAQISATPPAMPGDTWRLTWAGESDPAPLAGYAICCPRCREIHYWTTANNCHEEEVDGLCAHERSTNGGRLGSCWQWSGSAEEGTLTASPSLQSLLCGWHGWLRAGELVEC
jgi:hypothetical protein